MQVRGGTSLCDGAQGAGHRLGGRGGGACRDTSVKLRSGLRTGDYGLLDLSAGVPVEAARTEPDRIECAGQAGHNYRATALGSPAVGHGG
ncbi:hypothetical protein ACFQVC_28605 [Streptomyces monticola]|uniref:Uncharacterized protein n=1 Tax=Streptomyces monticola TaxID=2666263 RepID=A0ABW2JPS1_9ACTN